MMYKSQFKKIDLMTGFVLQGHILVLGDMVIFNIKNM